MSDTIEPTPAETSVLAELFSTTRRQSNLAILRAHVAAEVAKATGEDVELLNWLEESKADLTCSLRDGWSVVSEHGVVSMYETPRAAINAARAQQKDTP